MSGRINLYERSYISTRAVVSKHTGSRIPVLFLKISILWVHLNGETEFGEPNPSTQSNAPFSFSKKNWQQSKCIYICIELTRGLISGVSQMC
jgi:hypothetical protein